MNNERWSSKRNAHPTNHHAQDPAIVHRATSEQAKYSRQQGHGCNVMGATGGHGLTELEPNSARRALLDRWSSATSTAGHCFQRFRVHIHNRYFAMHFEKSYPLFLAFCRETRPERTGDAGARRGAHASRRASRASATGPRHGQGHAPHGGLGRRSPLLSGDHTGRAAALSCAGTPLRLSARLTAHVSTLALR